MDLGHNTTRRLGVNRDTDEDHMDPLSENEDDTVIERG